MEITLQNVSEAKGLLTVKLAKADYEPKVEKALKAFRQKANIPGFRPGMVPMGLIKKQYGSAIKAEEVNKMLQEAVYGYLKENKVDMLGEPLPNEDQQQAIDLDTQDEAEFLYDIALAPKFDATLTAEDTLPYYTIQISDEMVDGQVNMYTQRNGRYEKVEEYADNDMVKGLLCQLDENGNTVEGGIQAEDAVVLPKYMKNAAQTALFEGTKVGDVITINPREAYDGNEAELASLLKISKEEAANVNGNYSYQISEITRYVPGDLNQEIFDLVYGEGAVSSEEEFRARVKEDLTKQFVPESDYKFLIDVREYVMNRIGELKFADDVLKRIMHINNPDKGEEYVNEHYANTIKELSWHLVKEQLVEKAGIKLEENDLMEQAKANVRAQFAQYGMTNVPEEMLANYAAETLKKKENVEGIVNRAIETRLAAALKQTVKLDEKSVSLEEFNKMFE
ncbi:MAG: trigger factor [Bacteroidaceae bacterium]|nr:trigger factor [Bacteroidaceae bacterium]